MLTPHYKDYVRFIFLKKKKTYLMTSLTSIGFNPLAPEMDI